LDDANKTAPVAASFGEASFDDQTFPRTMHHENIGNASPEQLSKYDFIDLHAVSFDDVEKANLLSPDTRILRHISGREYQGYTDPDPRRISRGVAFAGTGPVSQGGPQSAGCNLFAGHFLYKAGSPLTVAATPTALTLQVQDAGKFDVGQYVVIYDAP